MIDFDKLSRQDLIKKIESLQCQTKEAKAHETHLVHSLQMHQHELEAQNRQLLEAKRQLEEARDRYADLYDFAPVGYLSLDESGRVLETNLTASTLLGRDKASIIGHSFISWLAPGETETFFEHLHTVFRSAANATAELKIQAGNTPRDLQLESAAIDDPTGRIRSCRMMLIDITEQKKLAGRVMQNSFRQEALFNTIPAMAYYKDTDLRFTAVSATCAKFFGLDRSEILGRRITEISPLPFAGNCENGDRIVLETGEPVTGSEVEIDNGKGSVIWLSFFKAPFYGPDGKPAGMVGIAVNVTQRREAEQRATLLLQENRRLTRRLFTMQENERRNLSHEMHDELGQWLTGIRAEAQAIGEMALADGKLNCLESAKSISDSATAIHQVLRRILRRLRPSTLDQLGLADSLQELVDRWHTHHSDIDCELQLEGPLDGLDESVNISLYRIVQEALTNISSHAGASRLVIAVRHTPEGIQLSVEDDGKGMDLSQPRDGLGLLGMRERVIAAEGAFMVHSAPGLGMHIEISLPFTQSGEGHANRQQES